jgi:hypothetical protein
MDILNINEGLNIRDAFNSNNKETIKNSLKGHVVFKDPLTGKVLGEKDNLILLRGRSYILELLFDLVASSETGFINDKNRTVCLFKIGQGGADINSSPLEVISPKFSDDDLYSPVPFIIEDPNKMIDPTKKSNPSFVESLTDDQKKTYYMGKSQPDNSIRYYAKTFESDTKRLKVNKATGEVYCQLTLKINPSEARGFVVNELGLVLASYNSSTNEYENCELFSHITFDPYVLKSLKRAVLVEYSIYA